MTRGSFSYEMSLKIKIWIYDFHLTVWAAFSYKHLWYKHRWWVYLVLFVIGFQKSLWNLKTFNLTFFRLIVSISSREYMAKRCRCYSGTFCLLNESTPHFILLFVLICELIINFSSEFIEYRCLYWFFSNN